MGVMEIVLIILGVAAFIGSFLLPAGKNTPEQVSEQVSEEAIKEMVEKEMEGAKAQIGEIVDETVNYAMEKTERSMDRLTNEKMMAVNEYSDTVLEEINKNHKEVVFLYDMLNDKHENIKSTVSKVEKTVSEVKQTVKDAEILAKEVESSTEEAVNTVQAAQQAAPVPVPMPVPAPAPASAPVPESVKPEPEFKPIEAKKVDVLYRPVEAEHVDQVAAVASTELSGQIKGMTEPWPKEAAVEEGADTKPEQETAVPAANVSTGTSEAPAASQEVEVTLNAAGRAGGRNSNERILELHKIGKSNMAIAKELGLGIGEVNLVIDLFEGQ